MDRYETLHIWWPTRGVCPSRLIGLKENALSGDMIADLTRLCVKIESDKDIRVAVLRGAGDVFAQVVTLAGCANRIELSRRSHG